jgi:phosphoglycerate dehydrogenase-like enzyme
LPFFEAEPLSRDDPLISLDNVVLTPHTAAHTRELSIAMGEVNSQQMLAVSRGEPPPHVMNREVLSRPGFPEKLRRRPSA